MTEQWTQDIRKRLSAVERPAPELDWDAIFRAADEQRAARRRKTVVLWRSVAAAAALAGVIGGGVVYLSQQDSREVPLVAQENGGHRAAADEPAAVPAHSEESQPSAEALVAQAEVAARNTYLLSTNREAEGNVVSETAPTVLSATTEAAQEQGVEVRAEQEDNIETKSTAMETEPAQVGQEHSSGSIVKKQQPRTGFTATAPAAASTHRAAASGLTAKAYVGGALGNTTGTSAMSTLVSSTMSDAVYSPDNDIDLEENHTTWETASAMDREVKHHQPLRLGLSVRYQLSSRWSIDAGISYSHHSTDITEGTDGYARYTDQSLTFIGIPVSANYSIWSNRYLNVYGAAGAEVERMVKGKATIRTAYDGATNAVTEETLTMSRPVFSANVAVGIEAKVGQLLSVYAEPGVGYHFKNGSSLQTIYSDKPLNVSLSLGVRFSLK